MLNIPVTYLITLFHFSKLFEVKAKGRLMMPLISAMPTMDPIPNIAMYNTPRGMDAIVVSTRSIMDALPARPWMMPTRYD